MASKKSSLKRSTTRLGPQLPRVVRTAKAVLTRDTRIARSLSRRIATRMKREFGEPCDFDVWTGPVWEMEWGYVRATMVVVPRTFRAKHAKVRVSLTRLRADGKFYTHKVFELNADRLGDSLEKLVPAIRKRYNADLEHIVLDAGRAKEWEAAQSAAQALGPDRHKARIGRLGSRCKRRENAQDVWASANPPAAVGGDFLVAVSMSLTTTQAKKLATFCKKNGISTSKVQGAG